MRTLLRLTWVVPALGVAACDVQLRDTTPAEYPANDAIGLYEVSTAITRGALVTPGSVYVFALGDRQRIALNANADGSQWRGFYSMRCRSSFPLQFLLEWKQLFEVEQKLSPSKPRQIRLIEPPLTREARFDTNGRPPKGGWPGTVQYRFVTEPTVRITAAHVEPASAAPADVETARAISVLTELPLAVSCGEYADIRLASALPRAQGVLVIDTDHPRVAQWKTRVEFASR
jgi:hypothetical protein